MAASPPPPQVAPPCYERPVQAPLDAFAFKMRYTARSRVCIWSSTGGRFGRKTSLCACSTWARARCRYPAAVSCRDPPSAHACFVVMQNVDTMDAGHASTGSGCNRQLLEVRWRLWKHLNFTPDRPTCHGRSCCGVCLTPVLVPEGTTRYTCIIVIQRLARNATACRWATVEGNARKQWHVRQARTATSA